jgi:hypothetical protein
VLLLHCTSAQVVYALDRAKLSSGSRSTWCERIQVSSVGWADLVEQVLVAEYKLSFCVPRSELASSVWHCGTQVITLASSLVHTVRRRMRRCCSNRQHQSPNDTDQVAMCSQFSLCSKSRLVCSIAWGSCSVTSTQSVVWFNVFKQAIVDCSIAVQS